jgi:hypothetical protein
MICKSCGLEKDPSLFYKGIKSECAECVKARTKRNREANKEHYLEYDRNRSNREERNEKTKQRVNKLYTEDPDYKDKLLATKSRWAQRNPLKRKAQQALGNAIRDLKVIKPTSCEHCRTSEKQIQGHHWSYLEQHWFDVIWLCTSCHGKEHKRLNALCRDPDSHDLIS